jgi:hypothetical protein
MPETVTINAKLRGIDEANKKAEHLVNLLKEASSLADELANKKFNLTIETKN